MQISVFRVIFETVQHLDELEKGGDSSENAWHKCSVELTKCAKVSTVAEIVTICRYTRL